MPIPRMLDDRPQVRIPRVPAEDRLGLVRAGHEAGGIAGAPGRHGDGNRVAGHRPARLDDLLDGKTGAGAEVEGTGDVLFEGQDVGAREIGDVDVVADAGAVGRGIIAAVGMPVGSSPRRPESWAPTGLK